MNGFTKQKGLFSTFPPQFYDVYRSTVFDKLSTITGDAKLFDSVLQRYVYVYDVCVCVCVSVSVC